jgi:hypothetical protein
MNKKPQPRMALTHLTNTQIKEIERDIRDAETMLKQDISSRRPKIQDPAEFAKDIRKKKALLKKHAPRPYETDAQKNEAYAYAKKLRKFIASQMPSRRDYFRPPVKEKGKYGEISPDHDDKRGFDSIVRQQVKFMTDRNIQTAIADYKHIMRRLDPSDPTITNIELIRPK